MGTLPIKSGMATHRTFLFSKDVKFGCKVLCLNKEVERGKFDPRCKNGIFLGYSTQSKGYRIWFPQNRKVEIARDVKFIKDDKGINISLPDKEKKHEKKPDSEKFVKINITFKSIQSGARRRGRTRRGWITFWRWFKKFHSIRGVKKDRDLKRLVAGKKKKNL